MSVLLRRHGELQIQPATRHRGEAPGGPALARLAANQMEEKYDWALTPELRPVDYASLHFDEPGATEAATEILASRPDTDPQWPSN